MIIEDNLETAKNIQLFLEHHHFNCMLTHTGQSGIKAFQSSHYDLVILDIMLPDGNGFQVCELIRQSSQVPIIMLTAKIAEQDLIKGLNCGADDYIKKPYSNKELVARVQAHLRRNTKSKAVELGPYRMNVEQRSLKVNDKELNLTRSEFQFAQALLQQPGRVFSREQLFDQVNEETSESFDRVVDVHMHNLRKKIKAAGISDHKIKSVYGIGYKLDM